ncbi:unnamed protein product, partial [Amoebophrya sp. A25]
AFLRSEGWYLLQEEMRTMALRESEQKAPPLPRLLRVSVPRLLWEREDTTPLHQQQEGIYLSTMVLHISSTTIVGRR